MYDNSTEKDENLTFTLRYDTTINRLYTVKNKDIVVADNSMWASNSISNSTFYQTYKDKLKEIRPCQYYLDILGEILSRKQFLPNVFKDIAIRMYSFKGENQEEKEKIQDLAEHLYKAGEILASIVIDCTMDNSVEIGKLRKLIKGMKSKDRLNLDVFKILGQTEE